MKTVLIAIAIVLGAFFAMVSLIASLLFLTRESMRRPDGTCVLTGVRCISTDKKPKCDKCGIMRQERRY